MTATDVSKQMLAIAAAAAEATGAEDLVALDVSEPLPLVDIFLLVFAGISLLVASFLIVNTFNILVGQRVKELVAVVAEECGRDYA